MPYTCKFCGEELAKSCSLKLHQTTAKFCLDIQKNRGLAIEVPEYKCKCGTTFTQKGSLTRHTKKCKVLINTVINGDNNSVIGTQIVNNNITQNITINMSRPYSMSDLNYEYILSVLRPALTEEIVKNGLVAMTDVIIDVLLQRDGKYIYYCTDASRNRFEMLVNQDGTIIKQRDPDAKFINRLIAPPLCKLIGVYAAKGGSDKIQSVYDDVIDMHNDGQEFKALLSAKLPSSSEGYNEEFRELITASDQKMEEILEERKLICANIEQAKLKKRAARLGSWAQKDCVEHKSDPSLWWHIENYYVFKYVKTPGVKPIIQINNTQYTGIELIGYSNLINGKVIDFGDKELKAINAIDFDCWLADKYKKNKGKQ